MTPTGAEQSTRHVRPELDTIASRLIAQLKEQLQNQIKTMGLPGPIRTHVVDAGRRADAPAIDGYRRPVHPPVQAVGFNLTGVKPAAVSVSEKFDVFVAYRPEARATFVIYRSDGETLDVPLADIHPEASEDFQYRLGSFLSASLQESLASIAPKIEAELRKKGYLE